MITEMNCSPTPQWAENFKKEIMADYNISLTDAILITGKVCKIVREHDDKAYEWLEHNADKYAVDEHWVSSRLVEHLRKYLEE